MFTLTTLSAVLPWPHCHTLLPWEVIRTQGDSLVPFLEVTALDYRIILKNSLSPFELALQLLLKSCLIVSPLISSFSSTELPVLLISGYQLFHTDSMPSTRLPKPAKLFSYSSQASNLLYSAFLLLHLVPNGSQHPRTLTCSKSHKSILPQRNLSN